MSSGAPSPETSSTPTAPTATEKDRTTETARQDSAQAGKAGAETAKGAEQVRAIQQALEEKGHTPGDIDGIMGPKTRAALRQFQTAEGMEPTGRPDAKTLTALGLGNRTK